MLHGPADSADVRRGGPADRQRGGLRSVPGFEAVGEAVGGQSFVTGESVNFGIIDKVCLTGHPILPAGPSSQRTRRPVRREQETA